MKVDFYVISFELFVQFSQIGYHFKGENFFFKCDLKSTFCQRDP